MNYTQSQRDAMAKMDPPQAQPDGSNPIANKSDLANAVLTFGLNKNRPAAKTWIIKRARQLGCVDLLPKAWNVTA